MSLNCSLMLTRTFLVVFFIDSSQLGYIVLSDSEKIKIKLKKKDSCLFVAKTKKIGGRGDSVEFSRFSYIYIF